MHNKWLRVAMSLYMKLPLLIFSSSSFIRGWFFLCSVYPFFLKTHAKKWKKNLNVTATTIIAQRRELYVREGEKKKNLSCFFSFRFRFAMEWISHGNCSDGLHHDFECVSNVILYTIYRNFQYINAWMPTNQAINARKMNRIYVCVRRVLCE